MLIEDEVADTVVDGTATVVFNSLQRVGVVADESISTGVDKTTSFHTLLGHGPQGVLAAPVKTDEDNGC